MHTSAPLKLEAALYVVATPIGNLRDISLRALDTLGAADTIAAEDTRNTRHLLNAHGISDVRLLALHQHNERGAAEKIIAQLAQGLSVALVTDAGTPAVSDPGALLVDAVRAAGFRVIPIPGASAAVAALSASGLANPHFLFYGFLPNKSSARSSALQALIEHPYSLVFYEAPHRILECVADLHAVFGGERELVLAREITKLFESIHRCKLADALDWLNSDPNKQRGEFVLLVSGATPQPEGLSAEAERTLSLLLEELPLKQAVQLATRITGLGRNELYQRALALKDSA
ncbi:Ribosomal RNA small subunit methyltransferase I [Ferriphaselus amnicola]|uniref:Ribosomal RNA small subunit methyltransferase I n=1 Tax=Ferriphaselus amnicola TaxID=1188319 RepID=A0A2Z6GFL6_9PROT|nr:16S rRNA (cytidine(1402)-2'-O)-methyltransferase [Ferriphaselus amnicola]BBE52192.1 Ribosomal RNA small subunit methyltransferase I [Ferriphaselus amnicola]